MEDKFDGIELYHVLRWDNKEANAPARLASSRKPLPPGVFLDVLDAPSIHLEGAKVPALVGITATSNTDARGGLSPQGCVLAVTTHNKGALSHWLAPSLTLQQVPQSTGDKSQPLPAERPADHLPRSPRQPQNGQLMPLNVEAFKVSPPGC